MSRNASRCGRSYGDSMSHLQSRQNLSQSTESESPLYEYLQNIDRELNELKKKRVIIEQQQGYFQSQQNMSKDREYLYNNPRYYEQLYDPPESSHSAYSNPQSFEIQSHDDYIPFNSGSRKRLNPWQDDVAPKRYSDFEGNNVEELYGSNLGPKLNSHQMREPVKFSQNSMRSRNTLSTKKNAAKQSLTPLMSLNPQGPYSSAQSKQTSFKAKNKVSKPKHTAARPNKLNTYTVETRKALIEETKNANPTTSRKWSSRQTTWSNSYPTANRRPLPGQTKPNFHPTATRKPLPGQTKPNVHTTATRKPLPGQTKTDVHPTAAQKPLPEQTKPDVHPIGAWISVSEQTKADAQPIMAQKSLPGQTKPVNSNSSSTAKPLFGKKSRVNDDEELMILSADGIIRPKIHGRLEFTLGNILKSMNENAFLKFNENPILQTYKAQRLFKHIIRDRLKQVMIGKHVGHFLDTIATYRARYPTETDRDMVNSVLEIVQSTDTDIRADSADEFLKLNLSSILEKKLNEMFGKLEEIYSKTGSPLTEKTEETQPETTTSENNDNEIDTTEDVIIIESGEKDNETSTDDKKQIFTIEELDSLLPSLFKKFVPHLKEIMIMDYKTESKICDIIVKTKNESYAKTIHTDITQDDKVSVNIKEEPNQMDIRDKRPLLFYVKLLGHPALPKRKVMQMFLNEFEPLSIKKHKKAHNLLFVALNKKNFDAILTKNGITIGSYTIDIKPSGKATKVAAGSNISDDIETKIEQCQDTSFGSEIDNQIDELLTAIRQGEEKNDINITKRAIDNIIKLDDCVSGAEDKVTIVESVDKTDHNIVEKSTELAQDVTEKTQDTTDQIQHITGETQDDTDKMQNDTDEKQDNTDETHDNTDEKQDNTDEIYDNTDKAQDVNYKMDETSEKIEDIINKIDGNTEKMDTIIEKNKKNTKLETDSEIITIEDDNIGQVSNENNKDESADKTQKLEISESNEGVEFISNTKNEVIVINDEQEDVLGDLKNTKENVKATPTRSSARLANTTPSTINTRRSSKLAQNNQ